MWHVQELRINRCESIKGGSKTYFLICLDKMASEIFKNIIVHYGFLNSRLYKSSLIEQVLNINDYWDELIKDIKIETICDACLKECNNTPHFNIVGYMKLVLTDWRVELMTKVANMITQFFADEVRGNFVKWNGTKMEFLYGLESKEYIKRELSDDTSFAK